MVEMLETAAILNELPIDRLLFLMKLAVAHPPMTVWQLPGQRLSICTEHRHVALCLLLIIMNSLRCRIGCTGCAFSMQVREWQGSIIFLHQVVAGSADRSYGFMLRALLACLPRSCTGLNRFWMNLNLVSIVRWIQR